MSLNSDVETGTSSWRCSFDFLSADAQFDIQESVIDYVPADSYWRAIGVGALNTLKIAFFGIILTTILGTVTGIARLSTNWLISNIAKWYIDLMRNTPLLLQLFFPLLCCLSSWVYRPSPKRFNLARYLLVSEA